MTLHSSLPYPVSSRSFPEPSSCESSPRFGQLVSLDLTGLRFGPLYREETQEGTLSVYPSFYDIPERVEARYDPLQGALVVHFFYLGKEPAEEVRLCLDARVRVGGRSGRVLEIVLFEPDTDAVRRLERLMVRLETPRQIPRFLRGWLPARWAPTRWLGTRKSCNPGHLHVLRQVIKAHSDTLLNLLPIVPGAFL